jgi:hypothetical protein
MGFNFQLTPSGHSQWPSHNVILQENLSLAVSPLKLLSPLANSLNLPIPKRKNTLSEVIPLIRPRNPAAIVLGISKERILALKGKTILPQRKHVFFELFKSMPFFTNKHAYSTVIFVGSLFWIIAAGFHRFPLPVKRMSIACCKSVPCSNLTAPRTFCASAGFSAFLGHQAIPPAKDCGTADTETLPNCILFPGRFYVDSSKANNSKICERFAHKVLTNWAGRRNKGFSLHIEEQVRLRLGPDTGSNRIRSDLFTLKTGGSQA